MLKINGKNHSFATKNSVDIWTVYGTNINTNENEFMYIADVSDIKELNSLPDETPIYSSNGDFYDSFTHKSHATHVFTNKSYFVDGINKLVNLFYKEHVKEYGNELSRESLTLNAVQNVMLKTVLNWINGEDYYDVITQLQIDIRMHMDDYSKAIEKVIRNN